MAQTGASGPHAGVRTLAPHQMMAPAPTPAAAPPTAFAVLLLLLLEPDELLSSSGLFGKLSSPRTEPSGLTLVCLPFLCSTSQCGPPWAVGLPGGFQTQMLPLASS